MYAEMVRELPDGVAIANCVKPRFDIRIQPVAAIDWLSKHRYGEYLFIWPWGEEIGRTTVYAAFKKICHAAAIHGFRFHDLRHKQQAISL
jgi:integrase